MWAKRATKITRNMAPAGEEATTGSVVKISRDESSINEHALHDYIAGAVGGIVDVMLMQQLN